VSAFAAQKVGPDTSVVLEASPRECFRALPKASLINSGEVVAQTKKKKGGACGRPEKKRLLARKKDVVAPNCRAPIFSSFGGSYPPPPKCVVRFPN